MSTVSVLTTALLGQPRNTRVFEACDGLQTVTSLSKSPSASATNTPVLHARIDQFLHFYLLPEAAPTSRAEQDDAQHLAESPAKDAAVRSVSASDVVPTKPTSEKAKLLAPYLGKGSGSGGVRSGGAEREVEGMIHGLKTGRALGVVVAV